MVGTSFQVYLSGRIGAAGIGLLQLVMSVGSLSLIAGIAGVRTAAMYLVAEELGKGRKENTGHILSACFLYSIAFSSAVAILLFSFAPRLAEGWIGDIRTANALRLFAATLPVTCLCNVMTGYFTAANRIGTLAAVEVGEQLGSMAVTMTMLKFWAGTDAGKACLSVVMGSSMGAVVTLICLLILRLWEHPACGEKISVRGRLLQSALPLALADVLKASISTTENLMVPKRLALYPLEEDPLAAFGIVSGMVFPILMFPACILFGLSELLIPELARCHAAGKGKRIRYLIMRSLKTAMLYGICFCGLVYLTADMLCQRLYGNLQAASSLKYYALMIPFLYCDAITDAMTKGLGQQKICVRYNILTSSMDVAFLFLLLPRFGMTGYFISFLISHLLNFVLSLRRLLILTEFRFPAWIPLLAASSMLVSMKIVSFLPSGWLMPILYITVLGSLLWLLGIIGPEDLRWARGLLRSHKNPPAKAGG